MSRIEPRFKAEGSVNSHQRLWELGNVSELRRARRKEELGNVLGLQVFRMALFCAVPILVMRPSRSLPPLASEAASIPTRRRTAAPSETDVGG